MPQDWTFEIGFDKDDAIRVDAFCSLITDKRMRLTREQLVVLRNEINTALRRYPAPAVGTSAAPVSAETRHDDRLS